VPQVLLLTGLPRPAPEDNAALLAPAFRARGWNVATACVDTLRLGDRRVQATTETGACVPLDACALLWILGFGRRGSFLDKMQLLGAASRTVPCVNDVEAVVQLHGKYALAVGPPPFPHPETWASSEPTELVARARAGGGRWVLKPPGGSFGRDVHVVDAGDAHLEATAAALTAGGRFALLQRWLPEAAGGEHRILVAGGEPIGSYAREPRPGAANLSAGGTPVPAAPDPARDDLARRVGSWLLARGVRYAGVDVAGGTVLEVNVVNPGGLATLRQLGEEDRCGAAVEAVLRSLRLA
jgi:glutathione synthase/RimK-type ligase-like ATP-grasp enzyme